MDGTQEIRIAIVFARFNELVTRRLVEGARNLLERRGVAPANILELEVPGSFEVPLACQWMIDAHKVAGVVALGAVIRGATSHYDYVCSGVTSGLMNLQMTKSTPVGFGILTCDTMEQALDRAGGKSGNKGAECADTVLEMIALRAKFC